MNKEYEIIGEFDSNGSHLLVVRIKGNAHVMSLEELHVWYGRLHPEKWEDVA